MSDNGNFNSRLQEKRNRDADQIAYFWTTRRGQWLAGLSCLAVVGFIIYNIVMSFVGR